MYSFSAFSALMKARVNTYKQQLTEIKVDVYMMDVHLKRCAHPSAYPHIQNTNLISLGLELNELLNFDEDEGLATDVKNLKYRQIEDVYE